MKGGGRGLPIGEGVSIVEGAADQYVSRLHVRAWLQHVLRVSELALTACAISRRRLAGSPPCVASMAMASQA